MFDFSIYGLVGEGRGWKGRDEGVRCSPVCRRAGRVGSGQPDFVLCYVCFVLFCFVLFYGFCAAAG